MEKVSRCYSGNSNHFERRLLTENKTTLSVSINAIDGAAAGVENVYITQIIASFNQKFRVSFINTMAITLQKHCYYPFLLVQQYLEL
jgi:hypothetical protein